MREIASGCLSVTITVIHNLITYLKSFIQQQRKIRKISYYKACSNFWMFIFIKKIMRALEMKTADHEIVSQVDLSIIFVNLRETSSEATV